MATYLMTIKSLETGTWKPPIIFVGMKSPWIGADTWDINTTNNWIGKGKGEYKVTGFNYDSLTFYSGEIGDRNSFVWFEFYGIKYPEDLKNNQIKTGKGKYNSPFAKGSWFDLEWSTRNIIPDEW